MRQDNDVIAQVGKRVGEIKDFYDRCDQRSENRIRLTISMLAYALGLNQTADVYPILGMLEKQGFLIDSDSDCVTLSTSLVNGIA